MIHVTPVAPNQQQQIGQAIAPVDPRRAAGARVCALRAAGQSDAAIVQVLTAEFANITQDEMAAAFAMANQVCPAVGEVALAPTAPPGVPATTTLPPPAFPPPGTCPPCPPHEKHLPWWVWALIGAGTATGVGLIIYAATRKKK